MAEIDPVTALIDRVVERAQVDDPAAREDLRRELRAHFEDAGSSAEALREAMRRFGDDREIADALRFVHQPRPGLPGAPDAPGQGRLMRLAAHAVQDLRFGARMLWRSPGFSVLAILCLTVGFGTSAAVFSWMEGILFRPFPLVAHQERMVAMVTTARGTPGFSGLSWPDFLDLQANSTLFETFIGDKITGATVSLGDRAQRVAGSIVSANYFDAIGVRPILGRGFDRGEDTGQSAHPVVVIGYGLWQDRFKGDPDVIGKQQRLNGVEHTIVGVAPDGFVGTFVGYAMQFWVPASMQDSFDTGGYVLEDRGVRWLEPFARLKPGVTVAQAQAEISALTARLAEMYPATNRGHSVKLFPLWQTPFNAAGDLRPTLIIMLGVTAFVLLIVCANVSNLLLVRALARHREMTVRLAIGAGVSRLLAQLLTEGLLLSGIAAVGGLLVAKACSTALQLFFPYRGGGAAIRLVAQIDWRVLALCAGVGLLATLLFSLVPALQARKIDLVGALRAESGGVVGGRSKSWTRSALVVMQVSLSFVLLVGTGLLVATLRGLEHTSPGFSTSDVLVTGIDLFGAGYDEPRARNFDDELLARVQSLPGVESAAFARIVPLTVRPFSIAPIAVDGYVPPPDEQPNVQYDEVGPGYLATVGIPLVTGREFTPADDERTQPVAVVNDVMAAKYWKDRDPIGTRLRFKDRSVTVVGVAKVSKYDSMVESPKPFFYVPLRQNFSGRANLHLRTRLAPETVAATLAAEMRRLDPNVTPYEVITLKEQVSRSTSAQRVSAVVIGIFGGLALLLSSIGLFGLMSYAVSQRARELGLRIALGAEASSLLGHVFSQAWRLAAVGIAIGAVATIAVTNLMSDMLYRVSPRDPATFGLAALVTIVTTTAACALPGWRATRTDPIRALRD
ncbi:MAG TPA: ABC transporter permease [Vicinamibacterales bacterium]|nr:ABC transporter permease [Vicinamibacterales bacterium]